MSCLAFLVVVSFIASCQAAGPAPAASSMLRGSVRNGWLTVSGPPMAPPSLPAVAKLDVDAIQEAAPSGGWNSGNSYLFTFRNVGDALGIVDINPGFCGTDSCIVPTGSASTDGKFYVGPFTLDGQQQLAIFDTAPTLENSWTVPAGRSGTLPAANAPVDSTTITFNTATNQWQSSAPVLPFTVVQDTLTGTTSRLHHGDSQSLREPMPGFYSVAYQVAFYNNGGQVSIQRAQNTDSWWAVTTSCSAFAAVSSHLGAMGSCTCRAYSTEQYGCPFQGGSSWQ